jgi:uncharacterized protein
MKKRPAKNAIIIFAKSPASASVKTRLRGLLSAETAGRLAEAFLYDTVEAALRLKEARLFLACSPGRRDPCFQALARRHRITLIDQKGKDLGQRMAAAFRELSRRGFRRILIIGSDLPTLPAPHLRQAFRLLRRQEVVVGPSLDGGYYLIGISQQVPPIFDGIPWSSEEVFSITLEKILKAKVSCGLLPFWYDVDRPEDLRFLRLHLRLLHQEGERVAERTSAMIEMIEKRYRL